MPCRGNILVLSVNVLDLIDIHVYWYVFCQSKLGVSYTLRAITTTEATASVEILSS